MVSIPLLGRVAAGEPILAEEHAEGSVVVDSFLVGEGKKLFALKVVGQSMIEDGILDGDYIFVQKRSQAEPGQIVVVLIDNEATCKRYFPEGDRIRLQPANDTMEPIYVNRSDFKEVQIMGVVAGVYRNVPVS
jgi:repressor LexA